MELIGTGYPVTPPSLSVATSGGNIALSWPVTDGNGYSLYTTTNLAISAGWTTATASLHSILMVIKSMECLYLHTTPRIFCVFHSHW